MTGRSGRKREAAAGLSVWALLVQESFLKVLMTLALLAVAETILFYRELLTAGRPGTLEGCVEESLVPYLFLAAWGTVFFILIRTEGILCDPGRYTMMRLKVTRQGIFVRETAYNVLCLMILFAVQVGLVFWFAWLFRQIPGEGGVMQGTILSGSTAQGSMIPGSTAQGSMIPGSTASGSVVPGSFGGGPQFLFLAFYRSEFLHCLLPMAEVGKWVRNGILLLAFGMEAAFGGGKRNQVTRAGLFGMTAGWFAAPVGIGVLDILCCTACLVIIGADVWEFYGKNEKEPYAEKH